VLPPSAFSLPAIFAPLKFSYIIVHESVTLLKAFVSRFTPTSHRHLRKHTTSEMPAKAAEKKAPAAKAPAAAKPAAKAPADKKK
jgi:hypothetical protein